MKTKILTLLFVAICATAPASAAAPINQKPQVIIIVDYTPETPPGKPHLFYGWCEYFRYFGGRMFRPCWP